MTTAERFIPEWGSDELVRNTPGSLEGIRIPEVSKQFLVIAGLPRRVPWLDMDFDRSEDELPTLPEAFPNGYNFPHEYLRYRPIGADSATLLCLNEYDNGNIYSVDIDDAGVPTRFVNSSVPQLAEFLLATRVVPVEDKQKRQTGGEAREYIQGLTRSLARIDPEAMRDEDNYWPQYLRADLT